MAFNNGFPMGYGYQMQPPQMPTPTNSSLIWVQGEAGAKSYMVAPNNTLPLWDSEAQVIYLKSADSSGMPTMKVLDYTIREANNAPRTPLNDKEAEYVTHNELSALKAEITKMIENLKEGMGA